jgi:hypothetical protein
MEINQNQYRAAIFIFVERVYHSMKIYSHYERLGEYRKLLQLLQCKLLHKFPTLPMTTMIRHNCKQKNSGIRHDTNSACSAWIESDVGEAAGCIASSSLSSSEYDVSRMFSRSNVRTEISRRIWSEIYLPSKNVRSSSGVHCDKPGEKRKRWFWVSTAKKRATYGYRCVTREKLP